MAQRQHQQRAPPASPSVSASVSESEPEPDVLLPENGPTSPVSPLAPYPPLLPTESRSRAPEFYGFVAWASTYLLFVLYLAWALLPDRAILALGVSWYPNREWALLVPAYGMVLVLLTYFTYFALALAGTPAFADLRTITDSKAHVPADAAPYLAHARPDALPLQHDIPLGLVNRVVYGPRPPRDRRPARPGSEHARAGGAFAGEPTAGDRAGR
ncbi:PIG-P-domain-containing protein [Trametes versicolor FP-101664 SS1]|uniref:PIG-P-domain-containing protein n=1 Tax=Trametes versicolor (strain FP-101664) TaxID=717944 RepID=UPI0004623D2A|nr:PIG-P-domain-containing protein [Trametes versicolor FP-101664 SS1]EIW55008.1 PIG-P-domain-containing protein [Trametes versicolor FP-101664 SS1]